MDLKSVKIIAVDFDGTLCENKWPEIGTANEELIEYLRDRQKNGDKLILWTCRVDDMLSSDGDEICLLSKDYTQEILSLEYLNMTVDSIYNEEEILDTINVRLKENTED